MTDSSADAVRPVGINHVALEVGDIDAALEFYGDLFEFELRGRGDTSAFIDMGDQFIALSEHETPNEDEHRHFGLVVDDAEALERRLEEFDVDVLDTRGLDFRDPWGNRVQVVDYEEIQFTKAESVREGMRIDHLEKTEGALEELAEKGMAPGDSANEG